MLGRQIARIRDHALRLKRQFGAKAKLGARAYRVPGYFANVVEVDSQNEREVYAAISRILAVRDGVFIDVGVNLGQTLGSVLSIDPSRAYLGFEPQVSACFFVQKFLQDNALRQAQVLPIGLADIDGTLRFWIRGSNDVMASLVERSGPDIREIVIPVRRGDAILSELGVDKIAAIKIDVEGAEHAVVAGLAETLAKHRPPVVFEVLPNFEGVERRLLSDEVADRQRKAAEGLAELFHGLGYRIFSLDTQGNEIPIERFSLDDREGYIGSNYVARPADQG